MNKTLFTISTVFAFTIMLFVVMPATPVAAFGGGGGGGCDSCGGDGGGSGDPAPTPTPTCTLMANPFSVVRGSSATLSWTTFNGSGATLTINNGVGDVTGTSKSVSPTQTTTYTLTIAKDGKQSTCQATVTVTEPPVTKECNITTSAASVNYGGSVTISWTTKGFTDIKLDGVVVAANGSKTYTNVQANTTYTIVAKTADGNSTCTRNVTVTCVPPALPNCTLNANPTTIVAGSASNLSWTTTNATTVTIDNGIGAVAANGSKSVSPSQTTTYTLTVTNAAGATKNCPVIVTVTPAPDAPKCDSFTAVPATINAGQSSTLTWATTNATAVTINNGVGSVAVDGSRSVAPTQTTTYTLTATGTGGSVTCPVTVTVSTPTPAPKCDSFTATPTSINQGQSSTLTWATTNATTVTINNGIGSVAVDGTRTVSPTVTTTYTLTATGTGGTVTCPVTVTVIPAPDAPKCDSFTATPASINRGASSVLAWATTNATTVTINNGIGSVAVDGSMTVSPIQTTTYTLTASGTGGTVTCPVTVTVIQPDPVPTCDSFTAAPATINRGESSTLTWTTTNATTVVINQGIGSVAVDGTRLVTPTQTTTYTLTASNTSGNVSCPVTVTVVQPPAAPTCDSFTASPATIDKGQSSTLTWATTNATTVVINQGIGSVAVDGTRLVTPTQTTTYTIRATGNGGIEAACSVTVTVTEPDTAPTCDSFTASPMSLPVGGGSTELTWATTRATTVVINQGIGSVAVDGSRLVSITATTDFLLTATDTDGDSVNCSVRVLVDTVNPNPITCQQNVSFSANPSSIDEDEDSTLSWSTTGLDSVHFNQGIGSTALSGSVVVAPNSDTTYILYATKGATTIECPVTISVDEDNGGGGGTPTPRCELTISDSSINAGEKVTIKWDTSNATAVHLKDSAGKTLMTTDGKIGDDKEDLYDDSLVVAPTKDTTYTLTAERGSKDRTCTVKVDVKDDIVVLQNRDQQPLVSGISLTQVPYTGFEAGPVVTLLFYTLLAVWALYLAYVIVIGKGAGSVAAVAVSSIAVAPTAGEINSAFDVSSVTQPVFNQAVTAAAVTTAPVGYAAMVAMPTEATQLENQAHAAEVLLSGDAMRYFMATTEGMDRSNILAAIIERAKASYPSEDGWVVLNEERLTAQCDACVAAVVTPSNETPFIPATLPTGNSSLAEAIVSGNIVAAYQMIGHRPMIALADAAADLDALYRAKSGVPAQVSQVLAGATLSGVQLQAAIAALTSALDGTYTDEAEAVKMAIMKAVKAIHG